MSNIFLLLPLILAFAGGLFLPTVIAHLTRDHSAIAPVTTSDTRAILTAVLGVAITGAGLLTALALNHLGGIDALLHGQPTPELRLSMQLAMHSAALLALLLGLFTHIWGPPAYEWSHEAVARTRERLHPNASRQSGYISARAVTAGRHRR